MDNENLIYVLNKRVALFQAPQGFRTSMDSVMLAAACPIKNGQSVLDLGCGVGSAGLCVLTRVPNTSLSGVDIQESHIALAQKNADENNLSARAIFTCADIRRELPLAPHDHIICNPPYKEHGKHKPSPSAAKAVAMGHVEENINLQSWTDCAWQMIKGRGSLTMIHEAERCDDMIKALFSARGGRRFGGIEIIPLFPKTGKDARRVIIRAWKHKQSGTLLRPGIIMHDENGTYTKEAEDILRHAAPL